MHNISWKSFAKWTLTAAALIVGFGYMAAPAQAQISIGIGIGAPYGYGPNYGGRVLVGPPAYHVHRPPVHTHGVYHPTRTHWTPSRGWHTHGHIDRVPHHGSHHHGRHW